MVVLRRKKKKDAVATQFANNSKCEVKKRKKPNQLKTISTGAATLNLATSDSSFGGFDKGSMVNMIGDSSSGKSLVALTILAEASYDKKMGKYQLIYDDTEARLNMNIAKMFGKKTKERLQLPIFGKSRTIEDFRRNILGHLNDGVPFIYILDSFDALSSEAEQARLEDVVKGKPGKKSYGTEKAKGISETLRVVVDGVEQSSSLLIIISQTKTNLDAMSFTKIIRSGGKSLKFYATHEIWLSLIGKIKKPANGKQIIVGNRVKFSIKKNSLTGKERDVVIPIYVDYGIDDTSAMIEFLIEQNKWKKKGGQLISTDGFLEPMKKNDLIHHIENNELQDEVRCITEACWLEREDALSIKRKTKYE